MTVAQPTASLTWLDHDAIAADRSMRLLASLQEKEARDEFGIGAIRDAISDQLFPGVSTIQTRLRYFFFIPWLFEGLDSQGVSPAKYPQAARRAEVQLLEHLRHNAADEYGIIGRDSGASLKRLPSSVYWAGLSVWGIRQTSGSLQQYFQASAERQRYLRQREKAPLFESDGDQPLQAWHPEIIRLRPKNFPAGATLHLTHDESSFLLDRWRDTHPDSLLTWLAVHGRDAEGGAGSEGETAAQHIWTHPEARRFPLEIKLLVHQARLFDILMRGAALLYNLLLARHAERKDLSQEFARALDAWAAEEVPDLQDWQLNQFWPLVTEKGHNITRSTQHFLEAWLRQVKGSGGHVGGSLSAKDLIRDREIQLKGKSSSRFLNASALRQWGGRSGLGHMSFRWRVADTLLRDWRKGYQGFGND